ncbi:MULTISPECIES: RsiV family protein [unclassified Acinetobacter]|uniref:RsiV family protein n=1 Tax=unclassified Acinetobacter TaxID=196816 RepID=UPI0015D1FD31|nr:MULTISPECIES: RsiV family protein [unclassified Acinetobacter]
MVQKNKIWASSILAVSVAFTACQPQQAEPEKKPDQAKTEQPDLSAKLIGDTEKLQLNLPECDGGVCPEISVERLNSNQAFIDEFIDAKILKQLGEILSVSPLEDKTLSKDAPAASEVPAASEAKSALAKVETPKLKLEKATQPYMQAFLNLDKELKSLSANQQISLMIKPKILNAEKPLATVVLNTSSYLGGAHGSSAQQYYNFDLSTQKLVQLNDILLPNQRTKLEKLGYEVFKTWVKDAKLADNVQEYEQIWKFKLSENFYLSQQGLILQYAEYEIGPYVAGLPRLTIPYDQLQSILKKQYLPVVEAAEASAVKVN